MPDLLTRTVKSLTAPNVINLPSPETPSMMTITIAVSNFFGNTVADLRFAPRRQKSYQRQIAFYLCRLLTNCSYPQIGRFFSRDHTTVIPAVRNIQKRAESDVILAIELNKLIAQLRPNENLQ